MVFLLIMFIEILKKIDNEEFDYQILLSWLKGYANPRMKIRSMLRKGDILRVKKGLYIFGERYRRRPYSKELLANLMYGPSLVSMDYMLSYYGLIPEQVTMVTSTTFKRPKTFATPVGEFVYKQVPRDYYYLGMNRLEISTYSFLAAVPERALADKIRDDRGSCLKSLKDAERFLFEDLRLDESSFFKLDHGLMETCASLLRSRKVKCCATLMERGASGKA